MALLYIQQISLSVPRGLSSDMSRGPGTLISSTCSARNMRSNTGKRVPEMKILNMMIGTPPYRGVKCIITESMLPVGKIDPCRSEGNPQGMALKLAVWSAGPCRRLRWLVTSFPMNNMSTRERHLTVDGGRQDRVRSCGWGPASH